MKNKLIKISSKRQITIPQKYYEALGFADNAECTVQDGALVIRPVTTESGYFAEQILAELIAEGYSGEELLIKFRETNAKVRPAVAKLIDEADRIASDFYSVEISTPQFVMEK
jgi:bifunctional DNA-binding transcriptional regulator/antitoxin component of YhaV-PrlF toxin-antitoxin module